MPNPKSKHTRHRTGIRRASNWLKVDLANPSKCPNCGQPKLSHRACGNCGFYAGRLVVPPKPPKTKDNKQGGQQ